MTALSQANRAMRQINGVQFSHPVMVGAGVFKTVEQLLRVAADPNVIPEWGSMTTNESAGNGGRDYHAVYRGGRLSCTHNSKGLPNPGMDYVEQHAKDLISAYRDQGKPLTLNVSGKGVEDSLSLVKRGLDCRFPVLTMNAACPNKKDRPILCDDPDAVDELCERAETEIGETDTVIFLKISCGMRRPALEHVRNRFRTSRVFTGIIAGNTAPNALGYHDDGRTFIETANGLTRGGMGGPAIHHLALDHAAFCAEELPDGKVVVGCGGVEWGNGSANNFLQRAGATLVQTTSGYIEAINQGNSHYISDLVAEVRRRLEA